MKNILYLLMVLIPLNLVACSKHTVKQDTWNRIEEKTCVVIGMDDSFAPMGFRDKKGDLVGFDVELAKEVFSRIGIGTKFQPIDWAMKETELESGNIDMIWNGYSISEKRREILNFSIPYLENKQIILTLKGSDIKNKKDLREKKVAVQTGSSSLEALNKEPKLLETFYGGEPILFDTNHEAFLDLEAGRSDAIVSDQVLGKYYIKEKDQGLYRVLEEDFGKEEYGVGFRKSDRILLDKVDEKLKEIQEDGTYDLIYRKWFE